MLRTGMWCANGVLVAAVFLGGPPLAVWLGGAVLAAVLALRSAALKVPLRATLLLMSMLVLLAGARANLALEQALAARLPDLPGAVEVRGVIDGLVEVSQLGSSAAGDVQYRHQFLLRVDGGELPAGSRLQVQDYSSEVRRLHPGDQLHLRVAVRAPRGLVNEAGVDGERVALAQGIHGYATVRQWLGHQPGVAPIDRLRERLAARIAERLRHAGPGAALVPALVTGDRRQLDGNHWRVVQATGVAHLVAISGLHVSLFAGLVWWLATRLLALLLARGGAGQVASQWALVPAALAALGYALLAGLGLPTQRALLMTLVLFIAHAWRLRVAASDALLLALTLLLWLDPLAVLGAGFWLSFVAVGLLALVMQSGTRGLLRTQILLSLSGGVLAGWLFAGWSLLAVPVNLVLVPLFSLVVIPLALLGSLVPGADGMLLACALLLDGLWPLLEALAGWPLLPAPTSLLATVLVMLAALLWLLPALPLPRWLALCCLLPAVFAPAERLAPGQFEVLAFDVGQGQMSLVRTREHAVLYDTGPRWQSRSAVSSILQPWLMTRRLPLALAFVSHGDDDHDGGVTDLAALWPQLPVFSGEPHRVATTLPCRAGQRWQLDEVRFEVLWPPAEIPLRYSNNHSCVVRVSGAAGSALLTGDIERPVEFWLAQSGVPPVDLLQVPHHGSKTSSSWTLLRHLAPTLATAASGHANRFGHPAPDIRERYASLGIRMLNTADTGMQRFRFIEPGLIQVELLREQAPWPWRLPIPVVE